MMSLNQLVLMGHPVSAPAVADDLASIAYVRGNAHARVTMLGVHADYSAAVSAIKTIQLKRLPTGDGLLDAPGLVRGSTDTAVATDAFHFIAGGLGAYYKAAVAAGTALAAGTIPADQWGIYRLVIGANGTIDCLAGAANFTTGYDTEADAIAALPAVTADHADLGYFTVLTASGQPFIGGADALEGGASGNPSDDTNYYTVTPLTETTVGAPFRWDFAKGPAIIPLPAPYTSARDQALLFELEASGTGGTTGRCTAWVASPDKV